MSEASGCVACPPQADLHATEQAKQVMRRDTHHGVFQYYKFILAKTRVNSAALECNNNSIANLETALKTNLKVRVLAGD